MGILNILFVRDLLLRYFNRTVNYIVYFTAYDLATQYPSRRVTFRKHSSNKSIIPNLRTENKQSKLYYSRKTKLMDPFFIDSESDSDHSSSLKSPSNKRPVPRPRTNVVSKKSSKDILTYGVRHIYILYNLNEK